MQLNGLMNILAPKQNLESGAHGANPAQGLLEALGGGFENILADMQATIEQTAQGLTEALSEVPEVVMEKIAELLGGMEDLDKGTTLAEFLSNVGVDPQVLGLKSEQAQALAFDGKTFTSEKGKTFDLPQALDKLSQKIEAFVANLKEGFTPKESPKVFAHDLRDIQPGFEKKLTSKEMRRPQFFDSGDDFMRTRELTQANKPAVIQASYAKNDASIFSKYAQENVDANSLKPTSMMATTSSEVSADTVILPEAVMATGKASEQMNQKATTTSNTLDLSQMNNVKSSEVINRIVNYLDQQQLTAKGELDVLVKHDELGQFKLNVARGVEKGAIDMKITAGHEGHRFFVDNEVELVKTLNQNGIRLSDFKIVQSDVIGESGSSRSNTSSDSQTGEGRGQFGQSQQGRQGQSHDGAERRRQLWEEYRERMGASA